jgi:hypothetical protein
MQQDGIAVARQRQDKGFPQTMRRACDDSQWLVGHDTVLPQNFTWPSI